MVSEDMTPDSFYLESVVCGHHVYKQIWIPVVGERLPIGIEKDSSTDAWTVAVRKCGVVVGHLPWETAKIVWYFFKRDGIS